MWITHTLWFDVAVVMSIFAVGSIDDDKYASVTFLQEATWPKFS